jgi:tight adherence protein C
MDRDQILTAALYGVAAAIFMLRAPAMVSARQHSRISERRRRSLLDAVGVVHGTPSGLRRVVALQLTLALVTFSLVVVMVTSSSSPAMVVAGLLLIAASWQVPLILARARETRRRRLVDFDLSDALGELVMGVEAGLSLESVMNLYAKRHDSPLATEFRAVLDRVGVGTSRADSLREMERRTPTATVRMFVSAVQQNERIGAPLAGVLRQQADTARRRRRQAVEEHAASLSLKMIFPTIFCILPTLMIVVVGPAVIRMIETFP